MKKPDFNTAIGRIVEAGTAVYDRRRWLKPLSERVGVSRTSLYRLLRGAPLRRNVDAELLRVLGEEEAASFARANRIGGVKRRLAAFMARQAAFKERA